MVKLILPNSAPPGQESQKCLKNSATARGDQVWPRGDEVRPRGDEVRPRGDESSSFLREVTKSVALFSRHFWLSWPGGAELGKMSFTIDFVYENYNF